MADKNTPPPPPPPPFVDRAKAGGGIATDLQPTFIQRALGGVRGLIRGVVNPNSYFGPGEPIAPVPPKDQQMPRAWNYPVGYNYTITPRAEEKISFVQLQMLSEAWDLLRLIIETRKDQVCRLPWMFRVKPKPDEPPDVHAKRNREDPRIPLLTEFWMKPDRFHPWRNWLRGILDDLLVIDAVAIQPRWMYDGTLYGFDQISGSTIKRVLDISGRTPVPPDAAYQQIIHGVPWVNLMAVAPKLAPSDQLIYMPRNYRVHKIYGYSPVEQIIMLINIAIRREVHKLEYYTDGSVPDSIITLPESWSPEQIEQFDILWNSILAGQTGERRKAKFIPGESKVFMTKDAILKDEMDDYLIRVAAYAFGVSPIALVKMVNRASGQQISDDSKMEGIEPIQMYVSDLVNECVREYHGFKDVEHVFQDAIRSKPLEQAQIHAIYMDRDVLLASEVRTDLGRDPLTQDQIDSQPTFPIPATIEAGTGAAGTKDKAGATAATGASSSGGRPAGRSSAPAATAAARGETPKGTDKGK